MGTRMCRVLNHEWAPAAIALALKNAGYKVAANYAVRDDTAVDFEQVTGIPSYKWDVSDDQACREGTQTVAEELDGPIEVLVNNAGIACDGAMHKMATEIWAKVIDTNLNSCFYMSRAVIDPMREHQFGRIINISSINGQLGQFGQTNYSASKAGILGFTKALARETAGRGITVNAIAPGYIETDMTKDLPENIVRKILEGVPVGRMGKPEEIARAVVFLAADE
ncbi:MAG: SDR family oxidoreductase, partial [Gemmataceae bacterium]